MWISELARSTGVPVATVKYYLREGLLPPGEAVGATRARYDASHAQRLRLVRALTDVAGLSLDQVREVLAATADRDRSRHDTLGAAHARLPQPGGSPTGPPTPEVADLVARLVTRHGWDHHPDDPYLAPLHHALDAMGRLGPLPGDDQLDAYAEAALTVARADLVASSAPDPTQGVERVVVGTLLLEPVLLGLRRLAQREASAERG